jgi:hypothetical protein
MFKFEVSVKKDVNFACEVSDFDSVCETEGTFKEFVVKRSGETPLTFMGVRIVQSSRMKTTLTSSRRVSAAVYKTRDGKFISSLSKTGNTIPDSGDHRATTHDTLEEALEWLKDRGIRIG